MDYLISCIVGYLFGSIPTAYLLLKKKHGIDITITGSGNVGAMNSYEVTNSKIVGLTVFFIDFLKGILPVIIFSSIFKFSFSVASVSLIFALLSHCFNPWINFNGGRGLATAAGGILFLFFPLLVTWIVVWVLSFIIKKDILVSNILATVLSLLLTFPFAKYFLEFTFPKPVLVSELLLFISAGLIIIFIKHIEPLKEILSKKK
jgi:acyl phosphate:glycerol-3-phosphate acyltransferase